ncbi:nucleotidyltransferase family protein [Parabacteroides sp. OttesenSCG-928-G07]|nr:nucleotidyltransferase family protein [Parabacteroides sp. OttesenSCG-928-G07]
MKAMIFAAGMGTRLKPLTDNMPKALVPVGGKPMLEHIILKLKNSGFDQIIINIHHFGEQIIDFLNANNNFGIHIEIADERDYLLDTGGGIKKTDHFFQGKEPFLVHNVDIFSNVNLKALYKAHSVSDTLATLLVSKRNTARYLLFNKENKLCGWRNHETGEVKSYYPDFDPTQYNEYAFGGIHVISPEIFKWMDEWTGKFPIINFYLSICAKANIQAYPAENLKLIDIGKPENLIKAEEFLREL